jgi:hypothetical protein
MTMATMNEFLNPKSMVTPGVAGGVLTFLVNGLAQPFPELPVRFMALALSFVIGAAVILSAAKMAIAERVAYWVLNSLIIFVVGFGTNHLGREVTGTPDEESGRGAFISTLLPAAYAQDRQPPPAVAGESKPDGEGKPTEQRARPEAGPNKPPERTDKPPKAPEKPAKEPASSFFRKW